MPMSVALYPVHDTQGMNTRGPDWCQALQEEHAREEEQRQAQTDMGTGEQCYQYWAYKPTTDAAVNVPVSSA